MASSGIPGVGVVPFFTCTAFGAGIPGVGVVPFLTSRAFAGIPGVCPLMGTAEFDGNPGGIIFCMSLELAELEVKFSPGALAV